MTNADTAAASLPDAVARRRAAGFFRRFVRLAAPFFSSEEKWIAWSLTIGVIALTLLQIGIQIRLNVWNKDFFNALENRDWRDFLGQMWMFGLLAGSSMGTAVYQVYIKQMLQLRWRRWLTQKLMSAWLADSRHYQLNFIDTGVDNPDQRIAENARYATEMAVEFALGIMNSVLTLVSFIGILWTLSGALEFAIGATDVKIPGYMVWAALLYAGIGSTLTYFVGRPIVTANIRQNTAEADFRFSLVRLRENSEAVALIRGEGDEEKGLRRFLGTVIGAATRLYQAQRRLMWLTSAYASVGMVYPTLVASPRYFAGAITLGGLMQITAAFGQVQTSLTWFVDNFPRLAEWRSHVERLLAFEHALEMTGESTSDEGEATAIDILETPADAGAEVLAFRDLQIAHSDGSIVIDDATTQIGKGEKVLIVGRSGTGKSTLFRAVAGLWPWGSGSITVPPREHMMFMPQRPYLPLGTLRAAIAYPAAPDRFSNDKMVKALQRVQLPHLVDRLDDVERWDKLLSGGEQQRIAFARLYLHRPGWVFLDEATSALDDDIQSSMMSMFREELAGSSLVSIAHRPGLDAFHDRTLSLVKSDSGIRLVTKPPPRSPRRSPGLKRRVFTTLGLRSARSSSA